MKYIINGLDMIFSGIIMYLLYPFLPKQIWIISERSDQAQDNGIAFFEYLNKDQPQINTYYLLEKRCNKIESVKKIGKVIIKGTLKHKIYFLKSTVIASTEKNIIEPWGSRVFYSKFAKMYPKKLKVFLQHGILDKDVSDVYGKNVSDIDLFVTSTDEEKMFVMQKFGYNEDEIANVGICRYDKLIRYKEKLNNENIILYMPTWRRYLFDLSNKETLYLEDARKVFLKSRYYNSIQVFLNNSELNNILEENNFKLVFITHHGMNKLGDLFNVSSDNIEIFKSEEVKIVEFLIKAKAFITDYSSIHFDSAYLGKTNIYYQFDKEEFIKEHAGGSYFNYERDGFGDIVNKEKDLIKEIEKIIISDNIKNDKYSSRRNKFFKFKDGNNCFRLYNAIKIKLYNN
ncbi:CDP-glycerol glycerophosphotransferase family protein [Clostridium botulinum]|uniref:CDP-glycerol glycerophosphotransferase family protein n=1 Tax=Clostridium botulinum TaxID=1491 RepID=UPI0019675D4D|nr:CDP-glycerol glycerophosphotransferase family protein [Clostridium botulinum]MBN1066025.1 hypothetical protein [Clostridium botulinum]